MSLENIITFCYSYFSLLFLNNNVTYFCTNLFYAFIETGLMIPKCEQYWPDKKEKTKKAGNMEITWRDETPIRNDFTQQKFEIANNTEGILIFNDLEHE